MNRGHSLPVGVEGDLRDAWTPRSLVLVSKAAFSATTTSAPRSGHPQSRRPPGRSSGERRCRGARNGGARAGRGSATRPFCWKRPNGSYPAPSTSNQPCSGDQTRSTVISFSVNVPVLSVQMTVVSPSVSTEERRRTSAFRFAMRCVPSASDSVTVGRSPRGRLRPSRRSRTQTPEAHAQEPCDNEEERPSRMRRPRRGG